MGEDDDDIYGEAEVYLDGQKIGQVTGVKYSLEPLEETELQKESRKAVARFQNKVTTALGVPEQYIRGKTPGSQSSMSFNLGASSRSLIDSLVNSYQQVPQSQESLMEEANRSMNEFAKKHGTKLRKPEEYAISITNLIDQFPNETLIEIKNYISLKHPELEIHDFKEFKNCFFTTGCLIRQVSSLSDDLSCLIAVDSVGNETKINDVNSEFRLKDGNYLVIKY